MAQILAIYGTNFKVSGPLKAVPLEWFCPDKPTQPKKLLRLINDEMYDRAYSIKSGICFATLLLIIFQGILKTPQIGESKANQVLLWLLVIILFSGAFYLHVIRISAPEIADAINGLIQCDHLYPKRPKKVADIPIIELMGNAFVRAIFISQVVLPLGAVFGFHWQTPWKASLAGYWLIPKQDNNGNIVLNLIAPVVKIVVLLYNYWIWNFLITTSGFVIGILQILYILTMLGNIE